MKIAILITPQTLKSAAYGIEELFMLYNKYCKSFTEEEIQTTFIGLHTIVHFEMQILNFKEYYDVIIIPPLLKEGLEDIPFDIIKWLHFQHTCGAILTSACLGGFFLAKTGLLNGKKATTHWAYEILFQEQFPQVYLDVNKILIDEQKFITAGGIKAYVDLCLYIIEKFYGHKNAIQLSNLLVVDIGRESQQLYKTFSTVFLYDDKEIKQVVQWMKEHLHEQISIKDLAHQLHTSEKTFTRRFKKVLNITAVKYLQNLRIEKAKELLISTNISFGKITFESGYFDENSFRQLFKRQTSLSPIEFRKKFQQVIYE